MNKRLTLTFLLILSVSFSFAAFPTRPVDRTTYIATAIMPHQLQAQVFTDTNKLSYLVDQKADKHAAGQQTNAEAVAAIVLAVAGLFVGGILSVAGILFGALAIVFGLLGMMTGKPLRGLAIVGFFLGIFEVVGTLLAMAAM